MANNPPPPICLLRGHEGSVSALHFTDSKECAVIENPTLISGSDVGEIYFWNMKTLRTYFKFKGHDGKRILYIFCYKSSLITQGRNGTVNIWKYEDDHWIPTKIFHCPNYGFCAAELFTSKDLTYLITPTKEGSAVAFYDYEERSMLHNFECNEIFSNSHKPICMCLKAVSCNSKLCLLMGFDDGHIVLWDYESKSEKAKLKCHAEIVFCLDYDPVHKNRGISGSCDNVLQIWEIKDDSLSKVHSLSIKNPGVSVVKIRPDGKIVITGGQDANIRIFSWKNFKPLAVLQFHTQEISAFDFYMNKISKYESIFASGSKDKNICLWSIY